MKAANDNQPSDDAPLRLKHAVEFAFPCGGMTVSGLRREHAAGRLRMELIAGKHFVTLAAIKEMRELCRVEAPARTSFSIRQDNHGPSPTGANVSEQAVAAATIRALRKS